MHSLDGQEQYTRISKKRIYFYFLFPDHNIVQTVKLPFNSL